MNKSEDNQTTFNNYEKNSEIIEQLEKEIEKWKRAFTIQSNKLQIILQFCGEDAKIAMKEYVKQLESEK